MPSYPGFVGAGYRSISPAASSDRCVNLFLEQIESKGKYMLVGTPGLSLRHDLGDGTPVRALHYTMGRCFAVVGNALYELFSDPDTAPVVRGYVQDSTLPASIECNSVQLMVTSGTYGYLLELGSNTFSQIASAFPGATRCGFLDGYFIAHEPGSRKLYISTLMDGAEWSALDYGVKEGDPENIVGFLIDHREVANFGAKKAEIWYDSGDADFPLSRRPDAAIEQGCAAAFSPARIDNSFLWLGADERGNGIVWRMEGYTPVRISDHSIENALRGYSDISDAIGYSYQEGGHQFYVLTFPTGDATWVYDVATQSWHERLYLNPISGDYERHRSQCHCFAFGQHLVGDRTDGKIYVQSLDYYDDAGDPKRWLRSAPYIAEENKRIYFGPFEVYMEMGVGRISGQGSNPTIMRRYSNDGGYTWSSEKTAAIGATGQYSTRAFWHRSGSGRKRVEEISGSDPVRPIILDASYGSIRTL